MRFVAAALLVVVLIVVSSVDAEAIEAIVCQCRCCYLGDCKPLENATWFVDSCSSCKVQRCRDHVQTLAVRQKTARVFETLDSDVPPDARVSEEVDVCEVISVLEAATCPAGECRRSTDLNAECFDRDAFIHKGIVMLFCFGAASAVIVGMTKNYLPFLHDINAKYFNY